MTKFDLLTCKDGDVFTTKDGTRYLFLLGASYNMDTCNFAIHNRSGSVDKNKKDAKDVVKVERLTACPDVNVVSETLKVLKGLPTKYDFVTTWVAEDPRVTAAKTAADLAKKAYDDAVNALKSAERIYG